MGRFVRALAEREWWRLVRGLEGLAGDGPLAELREGEQLASYRMVARWRDACGVWLMGGAGLRVGELVRLRQEHVVMAGQVVRVLIVGSDVAKGGRPREVPLSDLVRQAVVRLLVGVESLGVRGDGRPLLGSGANWYVCSSRRVQQVVAEFGAVYLQKRLTPHMLRHTFATRLRRRCDLAVVQQALGHARLSSTQVYMGVEAAELSAAVGSLDV